MYIPPHAPKPKLTVVREYVLITLALFPMALIVNWIFLPSNVVGGGLTGICSIIYYVTDGVFPSLFPADHGSIPVWLSMLVINVALLAVAVIVVGWQFCIRTIYGALVLVLWYKLIPVRDVSIIDNQLIAALMGGVAFGVSLAVVMYNNGSSGGTDILAMIVHKYKDISIGKVMVICDIVIILSAYLLPVPANMIETGVSDTDYRIRRVISGLCMTISFTTALDWLMSRFNQSVQFFIFSAKYAEIATAINKTVNRGVTVLDGTGWYSQKPMRVVTVLARKQESSMILELITSIDPNAFVSQAAVSGVFGQGFDKLKAH